MADSEVKSEPSQQAEEKPATTELTVMRYGRPVKQVKDANGRFVKQQKPMPSSKDVVRLFRRQMLEIEAREDGTVDKVARSRIRRMFEEMYDIVTTSIRTTILDKDGNAYEINDPKMAIAKVQAFKALMERTYGKASPSDEEMDAMQIAGVKVVMIPPPQLMHERAVEEEKPSETLKPSFIDAEVVETNKY